MGAGGSCCQGAAEDAVAVTKMDLSHGGLEEVPPIVFQSERYVETLNLSHNRILSLPPQLFHCQELKHLKLIDNGLDSIPPAIGSLPHLLSLRLDKNCIRDLPDNLKLCRKLKRLSLSNNQLQQLPNIVTQLISLEEVYLNDCDLTFLPASVGRLTKLKILELRNNRISNLPLSMNRMTLLTRLDLGDNSLEVLPECIASLCSLQELLLDNNDLETMSGAGLKKLEHLDLSYNNLRTLAKDIGQCTNLTMLNLGWNYLETLPETMSSLTQLDMMILEMNELTSLPRCLGKMSRLEEINVANNRLCDMPPSIGLLRVLRVLNLSRNYVQELPCELGSCQRLSIINASYNRLQSLPAEVGYLSNLKVLDLVGNFLMYLPISMSNLTGVRAIWLSANQNVPLIPFTEDVSMASGERFLTNIALPQLGESALPPTENVEPPVVEKSWKRKIRFEEDEDVLPGRLDRTPTPFPKELRQPARKPGAAVRADDNYVNVVDGRVAVFQHQQQSSFPDSNIAVIREANIRKSKDSPNESTPELVENKRLEPIYTDGHSAGERRAEGGAGEGEQEDGEVITSENRADDSMEPNYIGRMTTIREEETGQGSQTGKLSKITRKVSWNVDVEDKENQDDENAKNEEQAARLADTEPPDEQDDVFLDPPRGDVIDSGTQTPPVDQNLSHARTASVELKRSHIRAPSFDRIEESQAQELDQDEDKSQSLSSQSNKLAQASTDHNSNQTLSDANRNLNQQNSLVETNRQVGQPTPKQVIYSNLKGSCEGQIANQAGSFSSARLPTGHRPDVEQYGPYGGHRATPDLPPFPSESPYGRVEQVVVGGHGQSPYGAVRPADQPRRQSPYGTIRAADVSGPARTFGRMSSFCSDNGSDSERPHLQQQPAFLNHPYANHLDQRQPHSLEFVRNDVERAGLARQSPHPYDNNRDQGASNLLYSNNFTKQVVLNQGTLATLKPQHSLDSCRSNLDYSISVTPPHSFSQDRVVRQISRKELERQGSLPVVGDFDRQGLVRQSPHPYENYQRDEADRLGPSGQSQHPYENRGSGDYERHHLYENSRGPLPAVIRPSQLENGNLKQSPYGTLRYENRVEMSRQIFENKMGRSFDSNLRQSPYGTIARQSPVAENGNGLVRQVPRTAENGNCSDSDRPPSKQEMLSIAERNLSQNIAPPCYEIAKMYSTKAALFEHVHKANQT